MYAISMMYLLLLIPFVRTASYIPSSEIKEVEECKKKCNDDFNRKLTWPMSYMSAILEYTVHITGAALQRIDEDIYAGLAEGMFLTTNDVIKHDNPYDLVLEHCEKNCGMNNPTQVEMKDELKKILNGKYFI